MCLNCQIVNRDEDFSVLTVVSIIIACDTAYPDTTTTRMDTDDDDELQQAIRMSLQTTETKKASRSSNVIDLTDGEEIWPSFEDIDDMDFWKAIVVSMGLGTPYHTASNA